MVKVALLIGISEYREGLSGLPGTQKDISLMQQVLQNSEIGGFDQVDLLANPDRTQMESAIETLFTENRNRDDLVLLYFSGHGVRDDDGTLYFANRITEKTPQGKIRTSTAVPATALQNYMSRSLSKRQVLILDCCFSGAFANDMKATQADEAIDVKTQLGGEGRAVLTSSTATQASYEQEGASIYTRYLVQGLETGAADRDENGQISVDELHEYAKEKVQEAAPTMQPEIYAVREGYKILLARAPQGDARLIYRKEFSARAKQKQGSLSPIDHRALNYRYKQLGLSTQEAEQIAIQELQPYQEFRAILDQFEQAVQEILLSDPQFSANSMNDLRYFQQVLKLRDEDILPILTTYNCNQNSFLSSSAPTPTQQSRTGRIAGEKLGLDLGAMFRETPQSVEDDLSSEKGIDYTKLRDLLKAQKWKAADQETCQVMLRAVGKECKDGTIPGDDLRDFPCTDLKTINSLWVKYSNGHFGFSLQKQIYYKYAQTAPAPVLFTLDIDLVWEKFGDRVGWRKNGRWLWDDELNPSLSSAQGVLPWLDGNFACNGGDIYVYIFGQIETCEPYH
jgi:hypothetical protein